MIMAITSKCVKNEKVAHEVQSNESLMFLRILQQQHGIICFVRKLSVVMLSMCLSSNKS